MLSNCPKSLLCVLCILCGGALTSSPARAADKSEFTLLNPTPRELMRDLSTDRPDKTESAYTVDAGHIQLEMDIVSYTYDRQNAAHAPIRAQGLSIFATNWKLGLLNNLDVQLVSDNFLWARAEDLDTGAAFEDTGVGDTTLRLKLNLWGNDGGKTALALMPFITFETGDENFGTTGAEFGLIVPLAIELPNKFGAGLMTELDFVRDGDDDLNFIWVNTATVGRDLTEKLGAYVELFAEVDPDRSSQWVGTLDFGMTYAISEDIQLDGGINIGLTREADDWNPFIGLTIRY
jgi:hypothetical protein